MCISAYQVLIVLYRAIFVKNIIKGPCLGRMKKILLNKERVVNECSKEKYWINEEYYSKFFYEAIWKRLQNEIAHIFK